MTGWKQTMTRSLPCWAAMKLRAQAIRAAWHGDAETSARLLNASCEAQSRRDEVTPP